jgi:hypothetical protein
MKTRKRILDPELITAIVVFAIVLAGLMVWG